MAIKSEGIIATGHKDKNNCIITEDALRDMVECIKGPVKARVGLEHDVLVPPIGWVVDARLEPNGVTLAVVGTHSSTISGATSCFLTDQWLLSFTLTAKSFDS